ncbi:oligomeric Golgi complex component [Tieghemostelium lacteum]|uniref:Conserved oligomeric Golgi complex subunit 6 n=1 Tax=Tieghemostelium lacteum TaxID=361077 RepID=A0A152A8B0_TIELA|nr:oligomeric Golgi complex component [Tieghemostelium lacteum]|eukprot:KYR02365.1 oligomeric Golgi complex component [Tieghemostelium lacteum]
MNVTLQRKIQKVLETKLDSKELSESLNDLSGFYTENSIASRRNLRNDIERRYLDINKQFYQQFEMLNKSIEELVDDFNEIKSSCNDICQHLSSTSKGSLELLSKSQVLSNELKEIDHQDIMIKDFHDKFILSEETLESLHQKKEIDQQFYQTLERLSEIQKQCKINLQNNQYLKSTYEILQQINDHQEKAYRKLYSWILEEFKNTLSKELPEISPKGPLPTALKALDLRPRLLKLCLHDISEYRYKTISNGFITALSLGGPNGVPRPIEINAHDPLRYLGDMLAWIHQSLASEYELLSLLLKDITTKVPLSDDIKEDEPDTEKIEPIFKVLNSTFESVNRPLSIRLDHILQSKPSIVVIYKIISVLDFYSRITKQITKNNESKVTAIIQSLKSKCLSLFFQMIKDQFDRLERQPTLPTSDLTPTFEIKDSVVKLNELIQTFNSSLIPVEEREREYTPVFTSIVQKLINLSTLSASASKLPLISISVFMINCLHSIEEILLKYSDFTKQNLELISAQLEVHIETLVDEQTSQILEQMGIGSKIRILTYADPKVPLSQLSGMDRQSIVQSIRQFDQSLEQSFGSLVMTDCDRLVNNKLKSTTKRSVSNLISTAYSSLYSAIQDPFNQYEDPISLFQYKPDQIKTMLL